MKLLILGASGNSGLRLVRMGLAAGHDVTAFVRNKSKLEELLGSTRNSLAVQTGDVADEAALRSAMAGQDAVVNAAGSVQEPESFVSLVATIIGATEKSLGPGGRFWLFGGAAALDIPGTNRMSVDLPLIPKIYRAHKANFERISQTQLDWSMLCPGPMTEADERKPGESLRIANDTWPTSRPTITKYLPPIATTVAFVRSVPEMTITYEDAAQVILSNLMPKGAHSKKRVGVALPLGMRRHKKN